MTVRLFHGDCLDMLATFEPNSIDSVICDPPYALRFMNASWDYGLPGVDRWKAVLRVAKPGATLLAFGGSRTYHRLVCEIEDAGWEIRDCIMWLYGQGFPKSLNVSKAIDKAAGAERKVGPRLRLGDTKAYPYNAVDHDGAIIGERGDQLLSVPATDEARLWNGWGTALKPAFEPIVVAMKPLDGTFVENALEHGVAGLNIDGARVYTDWSERSEAWKRSGHSAKPDAGKIAAPPGAGIDCHPAGRWPANVLLDEAAALELDRQSGDVGGSPGTRHCSAKRAESERVSIGFSDRGGASRFFYCGKATKKDRGDGNDWPTVKPEELMRYLCRLTKTPTGGVVLDPFMGSGSTGRAAILEGRDFVGIDRDARAFEIARKRIGELDPLFRMEVA